MLIGLSFSVDFINHLFQSFVIHHVVLALLGIVCCREDNEIRCECVEHRRNSRKSMSTASEIDVFLTECQKELLHIITVAWTNIGFAIVEYQKTVDEVRLNILQDFLFTVTDKSSCALICPDTFRKPRIYHGNIFPFVFMRSDYKRASFLFQCRFKYLAQHRRLSCARLSDKHHFKNLTRFRFFFPSLLRLCVLLILLRIV